MVAEGQKLIAFGCSGENVFAAGIAPAIKVTAAMEAAVLNFFGASDRVLVMHEGEITGDLSKEELSEEAVMQLATQSKSVAAA